MTMALSSRLGRASGFAGAPPGIALAVCRRGRRIPNAPAAPADCWMATVANVGEVVRRRDQLIRRRRSLDHGRRRRLTRVHGRQQACSPPAL